jgi:hypothetical protein
MASATDWARAIGTTITNYLREEEVNVLRKFRVFASLEGSGNVLTNQSGRGFSWEVRFRNQPVSGNNGETPRTFSRQNLWKTAKLDYRGYQVTDAIYRREMLENRGQQALINVAGKMASRLQGSMEQHLSREVYVDGDAVGNELRFQGLDTLFGFDGTVDVTTGARNTTAKAADPFCWAKDNYAGLSTELGAEAGSQLEKGSWPNVACDPEYDYYTPIIVNYTSSFFKGQTPTWKDQCVEAVREGIHQAKRNDSKASAIDLVMLDRRMFIDYMNRLDSKERTIVTKTNGLKSYGFSDVFEQDGCEISTEYAVPTGCGYGLSIANMYLHCMEGQLITAEGPYYSETNQSYRYVASVLANMRFASPRNFFKLVDAKGT